MQTAVTILVDGLTYASWLFIVALGLTLVFGVLKILNIAHGSFYALGAYAAASFVGWGASLKLAPAFSIVAMMLAAVAVAVVVAPLTERALLRFFYGRDEVLLVLVTYALFLIMEDATKLVWGANPYYVSEPYGLFGNVSFGNQTWVGYDFALVALAIVVGVVGAQPHARRQDHPGRDPQRRGRVEHGRRRLPGLHGGVLGRHLPGRARRGVHRADDLGTAGRLGRRDHRLFRGGDHRRPGQHPGGGDRRIDRRPRALVGRARRAGGRAVLDLCRDGRRPDVPPRRTLPADAGAPHLMRHAAAALASFALLALIGWLAPRWLTFLLTMAAGNGLVSLGIVALMRGGVVPFGQGMMFAAGGYAAALIYNRLGFTDAIGLALAGALAAVLIAAPFAPLLSRYRGIFFAMLTLALSMVVYGLLMKLDVLGGSDGFNVGRPTLLGMKLPDAHVGYVLYVLTTFVATLAAIAMRVIFSSTRGLLTLAVRDNELRVEYLGGSVRRA